MDGEIANLHQTQLNDKTMITQLQDDLETVKTNYEHAKEAEEDLANRYTSLERRLETVEANYQTLGSHNVALKSFATRVKTMAQSLVDAGAIS